MHSAKKTVWITMSDGEVSKNILQSDIFPQLREHVCIIFLVHRQKVDFYRKLFSEDTVSVVPMPPPPSVFLEELWYDLFLYSVPTESVRVKISYSHASGGSYVGKLIKLFLWLCGHIRFYRWLSRVIFRGVPDHSFDTLFVAHPPNLVFAANLTSLEDARLLKAARRFRSPTIGMPKGWDNLTLKTFLPVFPDRLLVQTHLMRTDALKLDARSESMQVVGFPKFDIYAERERAISREEFMLHSGFDPKRPLILYAGAGDQLAPHDEEILARLIQAIHDGLIPGQPQILVRPHPKYIYKTDTVPQRSFWKLDRPGSRVPGSGDFEFSKDDILHLRDSLMHADLLIHTASTLGIEAAVFDTPVITIAFDGEEKVHPALSVARYNKYEHMRRVLATGGMKVAHSFDELVAHTKDYLINPDHDAEARRVMVSENAYVIDGGAGKRVVKAILDMVK